MKKIAIVDPYGPVDALIDELLSRDCLVTKISSNFVPRRAGKTVISDALYYEILLDRDLILTAQAVKRLGIEVIVAGSEIALERAHQISLASGIGMIPSFGKNVICSKQDMYHALDTAGVPTLPWMLFDDPEEAASWGELIGYPIVLKPRNSSGSDDVFICSSSESLRSRFRRILGKRNLLGRVNDALILQKFADGSQYEINCLSYNGDYIVTDVWRSERRRSGGALEFSAATLVDPTLQNLQECLKYALASLEAISLRNGPALVEVIDTIDGPRLVEINARYDGHSNFPLLRECTGRDLLAVGADIILGSVAPDIFNFTLESEVQKHAKIIGFRLTDLKGEDYFFDSGRLAILMSSLFSVRCNFFEDHETSRKEICADVLFYLTADKEEALELDAAVLENIDLSTFMRESPG